jgi:hypothetical protein
VFNSKYANGQWEHDWALCSKAQAYEGYVKDDLARGVPGQRYQVTDFADDGELSLNLNAPVGSFPSDGGAVPNWTIPLVSAGVGSLIPGISWLTAGSNSIQEKFGSESGYELGSGNYEFTRANYSVLDWKRAGHFARFEYQTSDIGHSLTVTFEYPNNVSLRGPDYWYTLEMDVTLQEPGGGGGDCPPDEYVCQNSDSSDKLKSPREMTDTERRSMGLHKVDKDAVEAQGVENQYSTSDGDIAEFIATNPPLEVTDVRQKRTPGNGSGKL